VRAEALACKTLPSYCVTRDAGSQAGSTGDVARVSDPLTETAALADWAGGAITAVTTAAWRMAHLAGPSLVLYKSTCKGRAPMLYSLYAVARASGCETLALWPSSLPAASAKVYAPSNLSAT
jgi:hypothetical protein